MKIKLDDNLAYLFGLWLARGSSKGVGVRGRGALQEVFAKAAMDAGIAPEKIQLKEDEAYFYHSAYQRFFGELAAQRAEFFGRKRSVAHSFLAGLYDGCGKAGDAFVAFGRREDADALMLERMGFRTKFIKGFLVVMKAQELARSMLPFVRFENSRAELTKIAKE
jgi:hypothetical protein